MAVLNEEQTMIRDGAKSWVQEKSPVTAFRKMRDSGNADGFDRAAWKEMAEMGWAGILIPEEFGGTGLGYLTLGLVLEETGRTLTASPLISTALTATTALLLGGNDAQKKKYLPPIAEGKLIATLAVDEGAHHAPEKIALKAQKSGSGYKLNGKKTFVLDGGTADLIIVAARTSGKPGDKSGITLFLVDGKANGLTPREAEDGGQPRRRQPDLRQCRSRRRCGARFRRSGPRRAGIDARSRPRRPRRRNARPGDAVLRRHARLSEDPRAVRPGHRHLPGAAASRRQDVHRSGTGALLRRRRACRRSTATPTTWRSSPRWRRPRSAISVHLVSNEMVQMHGGIGMTDAHDAGLYLKRARAQEATFGGSSYHRDRYATLLGY